MLFLPFINDGLRFVDFKRKKENRNFKDSLSINFSKLDKFPSDAEAYINDNFTFRQPLIKAFSRLKYYGFGVSPKPEHTLIGSNGWLFMEKFEMACYTGKEDFTDAELTTLSNLWKERSGYFDEKGIRSYWLLAPIKHSIYFDQIPHKYSKSRNTTRVEQLKKKFNTTQPNFIVDPAPELIKASTSDKVFYKMDNHWNYKAGYIASSELLKRLSNEFPMVNDKLVINWKDTLLQRGIHYEVLGLEELVEKDFVAIITNAGAKEVKKFGFTAPEGFAYTWEFERHFMNPKAGNKLKALVIRDSFGEQMMPFLAEAFGETLFIFDDWKYGLNESIVDFYKPDVVIYITLETLVNNLLR